MVRATSKNKFVQTFFAVASAILFTAAGAEQASAHHGWSEYDSNQSISLTGQIQSISYDYPHVVVQVTTADQSWLAVLAPPSRMQARGLPQDALQVGQTIDLVGYPHLEEANEMRAERITAGNQTVELR